MTEGEAPDARRPVKAATSMYKENLDFRIFFKKVRSQQDFLIAIAKLRSQLSSRPRHGGGPGVFDAIEAALHERLETLRGKGK